MDSPKIVPAAASAILWIGGSAGLLLTIMGALAGSDPGRESSHLLGVLTFGGTSVAALVAARLLPRRPRTGRAAGFVAAGGALFIGWLLSQSPRSGLTGVIIGVAIAAAGGYVAWALFRLRQRSPSHSDVERR